MDEKKQTRTYGELHADIDPKDEAFVEFCRGWNAACQSANNGRRVDQSHFSMAQEAQCWGVYTGEISVP